MTLPQPMAIGSTGSDFSKSLVNHEDILIMFEHTLKGEERDPQTNTFVRDQGTKPIMNQTGIREIMCLMRITVNKVVQMSKTERVAIYEELLDTHNELAETLFFNKDTWEIKSWDSATLVMIECTRLIEKALLSAMDEGMRKFFQQTESIQRVYDNREQKPGLNFSPLMQGFGGNK